MDINLFLLSRVFSFQGDSCNNKKWNLSFRYLFKYFLFLVPEDVKHDLNSHLPVSWFCNPALWAGRGRSQVTLLTGGDEPLILNRREKSLVFPTRGSLKTWVFFFFFCVFSGEAFKNRLSQFFQMCSVMFVLRTHCPLMWTAWSWHFNALLMSLMGTV